MTLPLLEVTSRYIDGSNRLAGTRKLRPATIDELAFLGRATIRQVLLSVSAVSAESQQWFFDQHGITTADCCAQLTTLEAQAPERPILPLGRETFRQGETPHFGSQFANRGDNPSLMLYTDGYWRPATYSHAIVGQHDRMPGHSDLRLHASTAPHRLHELGYRSGCVATLDEFRQLLEAPAQFRVLWVTASTDDPVTVEATAAAMTMFEA